MFISCDNCLFNLDAINFMRVNGADITFGLANRNYLLKYKNEDIAKNAYSKVRVAIAKGTSIVDISEDKVQNDFI